MALIVNIETSTSACSVALHQEGKLISEMSQYIEKSHSNYLTLMIEKVVEFSGFKLSDLDAIAVSKGPGSYTGLRIGVSTAKGLCFALDKPLLSVNTLQAMALQLIQYFDTNTLLCPMIDARRMEVYCALFDTKNEFIKNTSAIIIDENSFSNELNNKKVVFFGNGADKCKTSITHSNAIFLQNIYPSAKEIGYLAFEKWTKKEFEDIAYFEPYYLKEFVGK